MAIINLRKYDYSGIMAKRNTKEIILYESLKLFADKGYDGVTVHLRNSSAEG